MRVNGPSPGDSAPRPDALRSRIARALRAQVHAAVREALAPHQAAALALREALPELRGEIGALGQGVSGLRGYLARRRAPFSGDMTVHEAWARHRGVRRVFAGYHLPACEACAVGLDETLAEAAFGHQIELEELLLELNALLGGRL